MDTKEKPLHGGFWFGGMVGRFGYGQVYNTAIVYWVGLGASQDEHQ